jgi:hypothetical protein
MKASELRIGNFVYERRCDGKLYEGQVTEIRSFETLDKVKCKGWFADSPIPLTEEWLFKCGLHERNYNDVYAKNYVQYHKGSNTFYYIIDFFHNDESYIENITKVIKYVHQLQNLYFALTGEELCIGKT